MPKLSDFVAPGGSQSSGGNQGQVGSVFLASLPSNDSISAGDVVSLGADGNLYWCADPSQALYNGTYLSTYRPIVTAGGNFISMNTAATNDSSLPGPGYQFSFTTLSNGNVVLGLWSGTGTFYVRVYNGTTGALITALSGIAFFGNAIPQIVSVPGVGFCVVNIDNTGTYYPNFALYNFAGGVIAGPTVVESTSCNVGTAQSGSVVAAVLSNGNIAVAYRTASQLVKMAVYNGTTGASVVGPSVIYTSGAKIMLVAICAISGSFVVGFSTLTGGGASVAIAVITNAGTITTTNILSTGGVATNIYGPGMALCPTTSGFALYVMAGGSGGANDLFALFNSSGALVATPAASSAFGNPGSVISNNTFPALTPTPDGGAVAVYGSTAGWVICKLNSAGVSSLISSGTGNIYTLSAQTLANGEIVASVNNVLYRMGTNGNSILTTQTFSADQYVGVQPISNSSGVANLNPFVCWGSSASSTTLTIQTFVTYQQALSPIGVSLSSAAPGQTATVQLTGGITTRLNFLFPLVFDCRGNTPIGQYMSIIGNTAILQGIQAPIGL